MKNIQKESKSLNPKRALCFVFCLLVTSSAFSVPPEGSPSPSPTAFYHLRLGDSPVRHVLSVCVGLGSQSEVVVRKDGSSGIAVKLPGASEVLTITCSRELSLDRSLSDWRKAFESDQVKMSASIVLLKSETGEPVVQWSLDGAWPQSVHVGNQPDGSIREFVVIAADAIQRQ